MKSGPLPTFVMLVIFAGAVYGQKKMFCYFSSSAQYRQGVGHFTPDNIDPSLCTHLIFAFFQPTDDGNDVRHVNWNDLNTGTSPGLYAKTLAMKQRNPNVKVLLAMGGWVQSSRGFNMVIRDQRTITNFAQRVVQFLRQNHMDGMDLDWEFPGAREGAEMYHKSALTALLRALSSAFRQEATRTGRAKLILTMATPAGKYYIEKGYEPENVVHYPDYLLLLTYNYHGMWENVTGHHSTVDAGQVDQSSPMRRELNMRWTVDYWMSKGAPRSKLILGLASYGMSFTLRNSNINGLLAPAVGGGRGGPFTNASGVLSYFEVCDFMKYQGWQRRYISDQMVPYAVGGDQWVGYDDVHSIQYKVQQLVNGYGLAGAFMWSLEMDDFGNHCGEGAYPLLRSAVTTMGGLDHGVGRNTFTTYRPPVYPTTYRPRVFPFTTYTPFVASRSRCPVQNPVSQCTRLDDKIADRMNRKLFYQCDHGRGQGAFYMHCVLCGLGTEFSAEFKVCVHERYNG